MIAAWLKLAVATLATAASAVVQAQSAPESQLAQRIAVCTSCHGPGGVSANPDIPSLAGQHELYLASSIDEYRGKESSSELMSGMTRAIEAADVKPLAAYFSRQPYRRGRQAVDEERAERGKDAYEKLCQTCHMDSGRASRYADVPLMAGQSLGYLVTAMEKILSGKRQVDIVKRQALERLSREERIDALHYFASQQVEPGQVFTYLEKTDPRERRRAVRIFR